MYSDVLLLCFFYKIDLDVGICWERKGINPNLFYSI